MTLKHFFINVSPVFPLSLLIKLAKIKVFTPFYHTVSANQPRHLRHLYRVVSPNQFERDIDFYLKYFTPIDISSLPQIICGEKKLDKPALLLSFDDGFSELSTTVAPILLKKGIPATIFINPTFVDNNNMLYRCKISLIAEKVFELGKQFIAPANAIKRWGENAKNKKFFLDNIFTLKHGDIPFIENLASEMGVNWKEYLETVKPYLSKDEILKLASNGFTIGAHSMDHPNFADISTANQINEVNKSLSWIKENIPNQPRIFAFPFTNHGVPKEFYNHYFVNNPNSFSMMFGTSGLKPTTSPKFFHRVAMEYKDFSAKQLVGGEYLYYLAKRIVGKHKTVLPA